MDTFENKIVIMAIFVHSVYGWVEKKGGSSSAIQKQQIYSNVKQLQKYLITGNLYPMDFVFAHSLLLFNPGMSFTTESLNFRFDWYRKNSKSNTLDCQGIPKNAGIF